jgi:O-antigen polymerase
MLAVLFLVAPFYYHPNIGGEGLRIPNNITVWMMATTDVCYSQIFSLYRRLSNFNHAQWICNRR